MWSKQACIELLLFYKPCIGSYPCAILIFLYTCCTTLQHIHDRAVVESTQKQRNEEDELRVLRDMLWEEELEAKLIEQDREKQAKIEHDKVNFVIKTHMHCNASRYYARCHRVVCKL
jgi:hypothetical protein